MAISVQKMLDRIDFFQEKLDEAERDALADGVVKPDEEASIERMRRRLSQAFDRLNRALARNPDLGRDEGITIDNLDFTGDGEGSDIVGEVTDREMFAARRQIVRNSINVWRNSCKSEIDTLVNGMLDPSDDGPSIARGDLIGLLKTALTLAGQPHVATAVGVMNNLFNLAQSSYEKSLPRAPSLRQAQVQWNIALDAISDNAIDKSFGELVQVFKREHGIPDADEFVFGSAYRDWITFTESFAEGRLLQASSVIKRQFMTVVYRSMPGDRYDTEEMVGSVEITLDYNADRGTFSFDNGRIDDITPEVRAGLRNDGDRLYGNKAIDLPAMVNFRIDDGGWFNPILCYIRRNSIKSGNTGFYLFQRTGSKMSYEEQMSVFKAFMRARAYNDILLSAIL